MSVVSKVALGAVGVLVVLLPIAVGIGGRHQARALRSLSDSLRNIDLSGTERSPSPHVDLPTPVRRYLEWALPNDHGQIKTVRLLQSGSLRADSKTQRWMSFEAEHLVAPQVTGFIWNAKVAVAPFVSIGVRDALVGGKGSGHVALLSAFTVGADGGTPEMNSGSLHRFLAEAVWYPTALLPSEQLAWTALDDTRALATLTADGNQVSLEFRFAETGEVVGIYTPARWGTFDGGYRQLPWEGHFGDYQLQDGFRVPMEADVGWYVDDVWEPVWKGRISSVDFEFAP